MSTLTLQDGRRSLVEPREQMARTASALLDEDPRTAIVYAEISGQLLRDAERRHPDRVVNVGIREQLLVSAGAGMAMTGLVPMVHTFASFLVERAFEQVKLDFAHQDVPGVLLGSGGSFDNAGGGRTHQTPGDLALMGTLPGFDLLAPGHAAEVDAAIRGAVAAAQGRGEPGAATRAYVRVEHRQNREAHPWRPGHLHRVHTGSRAVVVAFGPMLEPVLAATQGLDVAVLYAQSLRPFDSTGLRAALELTTPGTDVVVVEPWLAGTASADVTDALVSTPHRLLSLGVGVEELRRYGTPKEHAAAHGLDPQGLRSRIGWFLDAGPRVA